MRVVIIIIIIFPFVINESYDAAAECNGRLEN